MYADVQDVMWYSKIEKGPLATSVRKRLVDLHLVAFVGSTSLALILYLTVRNRHSGTQHGAITLFLYIADNTRKTKIMWLARYW